MAVQKSKALLILFAVLLLCGCGQPLSQREIVRAVFFARQQGQYSVCLLLADQTAGEDAPAYKTASARGKTPAQALTNAESTLPGQLYYGLLDLAALPPGCDHATAQTLGNLLYEKAQPAPELSVFVLDDAAHSWAQDAAPLYEDMRALETEYDLHCGLQQLFTQAGYCAVPGYRPDTGYDFYLLAKDTPPLRVGGITAQAAAILCGQSDKLFTRFAGGQALCTATVDLTVQDTTAQFRLRDTQLQALTGTATDLPAALCAELAQAFTTLTNTTTADFFHLQFWHTNFSAPGTEMPAPQFEIFFE